jgi:hypothetical protein
VRVRVGDSADAAWTELSAQVAAHIFVTISGRYPTAAGQ